jgi:hypothetical protein
MSLVLTVRIRIGNDSMLTSNNVSDALQKVANRIRDNRYVEAVEDDGGELTRGILDANGQSVGEFTLMEMP